MTLGFIGWVFFALTLLLQRHVIRARSTPQDSVATDIVFASLLTGICALLWAQHSPWTYYAYSIAPVFFWRQSWLTRDALLTGIPALVTEHVGQSKFGLAAEILAFIAMLEAIVRNTLKIYIRGIITELFSGLGSGILPPHCLYGVFLNRYHLAVVLWLGIYKHQQTNGVPLDNMLRIHEYIYRLTCRKSGKPDANVETIFFW